MFFHSWFTFDLEFQWTSLFSLCSNYKLGNKKILKYYYHSVSSQFHLYLSKIFFLLGEKETFLKRFLGCSVAWLLLRFSLRNLLSYSLIRSETNRINVSSSTRKVAIPWKGISGGCTEEKERKRENTFFHKRAKTFPRDPLSFSLSPRVPHVYRFTKNVKE